MASGGERSYSRRNVWQALVVASGHSSELRGALGGGWHHPHEVPVTENPVSALPEGGGLERGVAKESVSGLCLQPGYKRRQNHQ